VDCWSLIVQLYQSRCNTLKKEKFKLPENRRTNFCQRDFFAVSKTAHLLQCKAQKHAALLPGFNRSLLFSTLFFTELLKRCRNYWKQICAASHKRNISVEQKFSCGRMIKLMPPKKKNKSAATAKTQKGKNSRAKTKPARKPSAKKTSTRKPKKIEPEVLPVLNDAKLKELYATMVKCRVLAQQMHGKLTGNSSNSVFGFEATLVGAGAHLFAKDCIAMERSSFVASLIKGTSLSTILARDREHQSDGEDQTASPHYGNSATALSMKTVLALAVQMKEHSAVTLMFCPQNPKTLIFDPAAMGMAATQKLPLVCLVESSIDSPLQLPNQVASGPYIGADPTFYPRIPVDGCDVVGVFRVAQEAIRRAREGHGPAVIECLTARSSTATKNGAEQDSSQYLAQDPISFMEQYLRRRGLWSDGWSRSIIEGFRRELKEAAVSLVDPTAAESQFDNVYSSGMRTPPPAAAPAR
jgi:TPP-dependent pyruvate/acetoin dehydrogenase alpha subunit